MLEKLLTDLKETYHNNLVNLEELSKKTKEFKLIIHQESGNGQPGEQNNEQDNLQENDLEKLLNVFVQERTELFHKLKIGSERAFEIQNEICRLTDIGSFELNRLKPHLGEQQFLELSQITTTLLEELKAVLDLDKLILPKIEKEIQGVKGELFRLQGAKMTKNAYQNQSSTGPRFIDKNK